MDQIQKETSNDVNSSDIRKQTSMGTLIIWNITKAIEANPSIDLKTAIKATQERLAQDAGYAVASQSPEEQYLACTLLAWQQLGHSELDTLHMFVEAKRKEFTDKKSCAEKMNQAKKSELCHGSFISYDDSKLSKGVGSCSYDLNSLVGPVVKLPVESKIVMRMDNTPARPTRRRPSEKDLKNRIDAACCMESACMEKLTQLDKGTTELRLRAERLARREAERVELLERAEAAWRDLELGYQRRLALAEEKEEDMSRHITKLIEERNGYKNACTSLAQQLRNRGEDTEKERARLTEIEKELCENACIRLRVSEEAARLDAALSEQHCKASQMDRDFQFKEEQIRRQLQTMESELESTRVLTCEAERAMHAELSALRQQVTKVSQQLLEEDAENGQIKEQLDLLRQEKLEMVEDLDGCKVLCDGKIQGKIDDLNKKRQQLNELKEQVMECQCKLPVDASVEVKRTPSLAALCSCAPEDKYLDSCSCTSLRSTLLTNLLADLFGGLQSELGGCTSEMPCQLLKCLEDRHNWDKSSIIKTNLRNYFSQLLIGELDIAIATSIEKYHAKWVGASCSDAARMIPDRGGPETEGWQERALERRAQKLACKLAEQLFQERADQLTAKAREIVSTGPPPCECKQPPAAVYPCLVKPPTISNTAPTKNSGMPSPAFWRRTHQDVAQLRAQLEDLKKDSIKKEDLKIMEENIVKLVQRVTVTENVSVELAKENQKKQASRKSNSIHRSVNTEQPLKHCTTNKLSSIKKKQPDLSPKKTNKNFLLGLQIEKPVRSYKKIGRSYAVNLCLCGSQKEKKKLKQDAIFLQEDEIKKNLKGGRDIVPQVSSTKQTKPIVSHVPSLDINVVKRSKMLTHPPCQSNCVCFHKPPSTTSIDKLLETLTKWKCDLSNLDSKCDTGSIKKHDANLDTGIIEGKYKDILPDVQKGKEPQKKVFQNVSTKFSTNEPAAPFKSNTIVANLSKSTEFQVSLPANTESEYMGAINLDKSNENVCRCVTGIRNKQEHSKEPKSTVFKCINSEACFCHKFEIKNTQNKCISGENTELKTKKEKSSIQKEKSIENIQKVENNIQTEKKLESDINNIVNTSTLFPSDCEYCIKFLGVTLTNATTNKVLAENDKDTKSVNFTSQNRSNRRKNYYPEVWYNNVDMNTKNKLPVQMPACECSVKYDEVKNLLNNVATKQHGDFCKNEDKSLDTHSLNNNIVHESCVCCKTVKLDESKDLELNAFHLLEEHLRGKLEEFKLSNYIPPEEEEKIFSTILQRVKKIITDSTNVIACRCASEVPAEGSWHRAYMLLQEYLKIKIKRVQCLCLSSEDNKEAVYPNVMEKVYNLIDNDFQRIKEIWKCQNNPEPQNLNHNIEFPEKDNCCTLQGETNRLQNIEKMSKEISNRSLIVTQNISSQISPNVEMETKSCDIMEMPNQNTDTDNKNKCCEITKLNNDKCFCINSTSINKSYEESFGTKEIFVNQCVNVVQEGKEVSLPINEKRLQEADLLSQHPQKKCGLSSELDKIPDLRKSTPYIGYTVDCSCENALGICTCTKSLISGKSDNINSIWNTLTSNKLHNNNISYIMNAVPKKGSTEVNDLKNAHNIVPPHLVKKITCDTVVSAQDCEELILKDSRTKINKTFLSTTTSGEEVKYGPDLNSKGLMEWSEENNILKQKMCNVNDFNDNTCDDSLYYPVRNLMSQGAKEGLVKSDLIGSLSSNCDCNMVPMCHVKMLVENIENKLLHSNCTCDSLCSKICPVHSKKL